MKQRPGDQPLPTESAHPPVHMTLTTRVPHDLLDRLELGIKRYGQPLAAFNGRDAGRDAYEEWLDLGVYLQQLREEKAELQRRLDNVRALAENRLRGINLELVYDLRAICDGSDRG